MNKAILVGRLTRDPEVRFTTGEEQMAIARFTVAINRRGESDKADFISCVAFGRTAEFIEKYFTRGKKIGIAGHIQTGSYTNKDGVKVYTTDVIVDECEFVESKGSNEAADEAPSSNDGFMNLDDDIAEELPFK